MTPVGNCTTKAIMHRDVYGRYCSLPYWYEQQLWQKIVLAGIWDHVIIPFKRPEKAFSVRTLTGKKIEINAFGCETILDVKEKIREKEGIPPDQQRLIWCRKYLEDTVTIDKYKIESGCVAHLVLLLRGGARTKQTTLILQSVKRKQEEGEEDKSSAKKRLRSAKGQVTSSIKDSAK